MPNTGTPEATSAFALSIAYVEHGGIAGAVAQEHAVGPSRQQFRSRRRRRIHANVAAVRAQPAQDVPFHPEVVRGNLQPALRETSRRHAELARLLRRPVERGTSGDVAHEVRPFHLRQRLRARDEGLRIEVVAGHDDAAHHAARSQLPRERPRVDVGDGDDAVGDKVVAQRALRAPVAGHRRLLAHDEPSDMRRLRFPIRRRHAVVPDLRARHRHDLTGVRGVGQHFLIARHARVEHDFAAGHTFGAGGLSAEPRAVFQRKNRLCAHPPALKFEVLHF